MLPNSPEKNKKIKPQLKKNKMLPPPKNIMPENIGIHTSLIYEDHHLICVGTILITLFALQSNVTTWHEGIFQISCIDHINILLKMEYVYVYQEKQENNNTCACRAANIFLIFDTNFQIQICICKAYSNKLVSNGWSPLPILGKCNLKMKYGPKRCQADLFCHRPKVQSIIGA